METQKQISGKYNWKAKYNIKTGKIILQYNI